MARLGFISAEFAGGMFGDVLDSIVRAGGSTVQLDLASAAGTTFPEAINPDEIENVRAALAARVIEAAALTGVTTWSIRTSWSEAVGAIACRH